MRNYIGFSCAPDAAAAIGEATAGMGTADIKLVLFTSDSERFELFSRLLRLSFPNAEILGSTTYTAISSLGSDNTALSLLALGGDMECRAGLILDISRYPMKHKNVVDNCLAHMCSRENLLCFEIMTAFSNAEELVLDTFQAALGDGVPVFGGSAGARNGDKATMVSINGSVYSEGCVFALIASPRKVFVFHENIYKSTEHQFIATDVDCEHRTVYEFNRRPAAQVIADALGVDIPKLPELLPRHPLGRIIANEIYLVEGYDVRDEGEIEFFARIYNNTRMALMELDDFDRVSAETLKVIRDHIQNPSFAIVINCLSRSKLFESAGYLERFFCGGSFPGAFFGMSGYGEQINGKHLNASMVTAVFE